MISRVIFRSFTTFAAISWAVLAGGCTYVEEEDGCDLRVTFLNVGQGLAVLLEAGGRFALYDTGPDSVGVVDSLAARGIDTLEWVVVSHNHRDHAGGLMEFGGDVPKGAGSGLAQNTKTGSALRVYVRQLFVGPDTAGGFIRDSVLRLAKNFGIPVDTLVRGMVIDLGEEVSCTNAKGPRMDVLWPPERLRIGENGASVVLHVDYGASTVLLPGDLDSAGERRLLELSPTLRAELLQVGHHGSAASNTLGFVSKLQPRYAVVSVGAGNSYGHPASSVVRKFEYVLGDSSNFFRTDRDGSVTFDLRYDLGVMSP